MGALASALLNPAVLSVLVSSGIGALGSAFTPEAHERFVFKEGNDRIDQKNATYTGNRLRAIDAQNVAREVPQQRIHYNIAPGQYSRSDYGVLPHTNQRIRFGGVPLSTYGQAVPTGQPVSYTPTTPTTPVTPPETFTPFNTVPPWGVGDNVNPVGINDDQQQDRDIAEQEHQTQINSVLTNINTGDDGNVVDNVVGDGILSGTQSVNLKAGDLADYNKQVWDTREVWENTPSRAEEWAWKGNYTGVDDSGKFSWGADKKIESEPLPDWSKTQQG
jgi:hypothetical protein